MKYDDWDDEEDGEWEAPMIDNPEFKDDAEYYDWDADHYGRCPCVDAAAAAPGDGDASRPGRRAITRGAPPSAPPPSGSSDPGQAPDASPPGDGPSQGGPPRGSPWPAISK